MISVQDYSCRGPFQQCNVHVCLDVCILCVCVRACACLCVSVWNTAAGRQHGYGGVQWPISSLSVAISAQRQRPGPLSLSVLSRHVCGGIVAHPVMDSQSRGCVDSTWGLMPLARSTDADGTLFGEPLGLVVRSGMAPGEGLQLASVAFENLGWWSGNGRQHEGA